MTRLFPTVRYLKPVQLYGRVWFKLYRPKPDLSAAPSLRSLSGDWNIVPEKPVSLLRPWCFRFLNSEYDCRFPEGWNDPDCEKLWLYNLHYFDDLQGEDAEVRKEWHKELIEKWIDENPPGIGNGWEPYPLSLRIVNWIKWVLAGNRLSTHGIQSLAVQIRYLSKRLEYHLLGNHLFANGKALLFAGIFFTGNEAKRWRNKGLRIIEKEIEEQILNDGGHFERSPMYHSIILEDLLDLINIMQAFGFKISDKWLSAAENMLDWLTGMTHPDGDIVLFNDAAFGIAAKPEELFAYGQRLGLRAAALKESGLNHFRETGYISWRQKNVAAYLDVAPIGPDYLPGHAHADTLSFELSLFNMRVIVDSGTSCYGIGSERLRQRGTGAHNTVMIDGENSSEVWSGFRVARRARPFGLQTHETADELVVSCAHDGYKRLKGKPIHSRAWRLLKNKIEVTDSIQGNHKTAIAYYHLHPEVEVSFDGFQGGSLQIPGGQVLDWSVSGGQVNVVDSTYHPGFGLTVPNKLIQVMFFGPEATFKMGWESS